MLRKTKLISSFFVVFMKLILFSRTLYSAAVVFLFPGAKNCTCAQTSGLTLNPIN